MLPRLGAPGLMRLVTKRAKTSPDVFGPASYSPTAIRLRLVEVA